MKIRTGFVSNSSSASFVIKNYKKMLSPFQLHRLINFQFFSKDSASDGWEIEVAGNNLMGRTYMDNGGLPEYMVNELFIHPSLIAYYGDSGGRDDEELPKPNWVKKEDTED